MSEQEQAKQESPAAPQVAAPQVTRPWVFGLMALAFGVSVGIGWLTASSPDEAAAAAAPSSSPVYKIPVTMSQPSLGPEDALVTLVQWCDFPDQGCKRAEPAVKALMKRHGGDVRLAFRHFISDSRRDSSQAHQFSRAAFEQGGKFWEVRELLLAHQGEIKREDFERYAKQVGLDWAAASKAMDANTYSSAVAADRIFAQMFDVREPAAFFVNGRRLQGDVTEASLGKLVEEELGRAKKLVAGGVQKSELYAEVTKNGVWNKPSVPKELGR
jgi:protein-disulfide isomerase